MFWAPGVSLGLLMMWDIKLKILVIWEFFWEHESFENYRKYFP